MPSGQLLAQTSQGDKAAVRLVKPSTAFACRLVCLGFRALGLPKRGFSAISLIFQISKNESELLRAGSGRTGLCGRLATPLGRLGEPALQLLTQPDGRVGVRTDQMRRGLMH
eukprot:scaffold197452_cov27-Tisochrysis_lutea.AAC.1